jgi:nucleoid-associated protein YgaU
MAESLARMAAGRRQAPADMPAAAAPEAIAAGSPLSVNDAPLSQVRVVELTDGKTFEAPSAPPDDQHRVPENEERRP